MTEADCCSPHPGPVAAVVLVRMRYPITGVRRAFPYCSQCAELVGLLRPARIGYYHGFFPMRRIERGRRYVRALRAEIAREDGPQCRYCRRGLGPDEQTLDHVDPISTGGPTTRDNLVLACPTCNVRKGGRCVRRWLRATHLAFVLDGSYRHREGPQPSYMEAWEGRRCPGASEILPSRLTG